MYRLATNGKKADLKQKQTSVRNCKKVFTHADHGYYKQWSAAIYGIAYVVHSTIGYHSNS